MNSIAATAKMSFELETSIVLLPRKGNDGSFGNSVDDLIGKGMPMITMQEAAEAFMLT